jgi:spore germination protein YaaH
MAIQNINAEERRLMILRGIGQDHTTIEIAAEMGVRKWMVLNDLRAMNYSRDPELKQAYLDKETRAHAGKQSLVNIRDERFHNMTGMTFQEKNFENMINYYKAELDLIYKSKDEFTAITGLSGDIRKTLKRNDILTGHRGKIQLTAKARDYLRN